MCKNEEPNTSTHVFLRPAKSGIITEIYFVIFEIPEIRTNHLKRGHG